MSFFNLMEISYYSHEKKNCKLQISITFANLFASKITQNTMTHADINALRYILIIELFYK